MKKETKEEIKKHVATGVSAAAGATAGVVIGATIFPQEVDAQPNPMPEPNLPHPTAHKPTPEPAKPQPAKPEPSQEGSQTDEIEVVSYDRVTTGDGDKIDVAVLNVNGNEVGVIDANLDGEADAIVCDANHNGVIEDNEIKIVHGQGISMQPFQDATGFNPHYVQNEIPDYVNDADVDTYMA